MVGEASDGEEAVALARELEPDLAVMDVKMPQLDGIDAARRILEERPMPIVMLTAFGEQELVERAAEAGVFGYLVKPFREQDLRARDRDRAGAPRRARGRARRGRLARRGARARKAIERAKGLLMEKERLSEADAFARLRKASQVSGRPLRVIAEAVIATFEPVMSHDRHAAAGARSRGHRLRAGDAWRVIVLNDDHNTFEGVAFALAQTIPGRRLRQGHAAREQDPHDRPGGRLVGPPRAGRALPLAARAATA